MTAPTPRQFELAIAQALASISEAHDRIRAELEALPRRYEDAYEAAHLPAKHDGAGKISTGSRSDPTAALVGDPYDSEHLGTYNKIKTMLEKVPGKLVVAENLVESIAGSIDRAIDSLGPKAAFGDAIQMEGGGATRDQIREAYGAAERRSARGEGQPPDGRTTGLRQDLKIKAGM